MLFLLSESCGEAHNRTHPLRYVTHVIFFYIWIPQFSLQCLPCHFSRLPTALYSSPNNQKDSNQTWNYRSTTSVRVEDVLKIILYKVNYIINQQL